jgi:hypothetical protein
MRAALTLGLIGAASYLAWRWFKHAQFKGALGERAYESLSALRPTITAPPIHVPAPPRVM